MFGAMGCFGRDGMFAARWNVRRATGCQARNGILGPRVRFAAVLSNALGLVSSVQNFGSPINKMMQCDISP
jgi:hypothetical protein